MQYDDFTHVTHAPRALLLLLITVLVTGSVLVTSPVPVQAVRPARKSGDLAVIQPSSEMTATENVTSSPGLAATDVYTYHAYVSMVFAPPPPPICPLSSSNSYEAIGYIGGQGGTYKGNRLTDENADFRLSIIGYAPNNSYRGLVGYNGDSDTDAPKFYNMFNPARVPAFTQISQIYHWNWNESLPAPYGTRGTLNNDYYWASTTVMDMQTTPGEILYIPSRDAPIAGGGYKVLVLYAGEQELTIAYFLYDNVLTPSLNGYVVHMLNICVDPNLLATYRAQLNASGKRATYKLPAIRNSQVVGTALGVTMTVAIRDGAKYMDPRDANAWWRGHP